MGSFVRRVKDDPANVQFLCINTLEGFATRWPSDMTTSLTSSELHKLRGGRGFIYINVFDFPQSRMLILDVGKDCSTDYSRKKLDQS